MASEFRERLRLIDLMVALVVVAVGLALLPHYLSGRGCGARPHCANNMRQLGLALLNHWSTAGSFPNAGTFRDDPALHGGDPTKSNIYLSIVAPGQSPGSHVSWLRSWVVDVLPYLDQQDLANAWDRAYPYWWPTQTIPDQPANLQISNVPLRVLCCPEDRTAGPGKGNLSYVVNGGFTRWPAVPVGWAGSPVDGQAWNGGIRQWVPPGRPWPESQAIGQKLGVMFLGTELGDQPWDIKTTPANLLDGASNTLLIAENTLAGFSPGNRYSGGRATNWACPLPNFIMFMGSDDVCMTSRSPNDCLGGQLAPVSSGRDGPGWARANRSGTYENISFGQKLRAEGSFPFANSPHVNGGNFVFCDGAVRFLKDSINGTVYAKLLTPAGGRLPSQFMQRPLTADALE